MGALFMLACLALFIFMIWRGMAGTASLDTAMSAGDVVHHAVRVMTMRNWTMTSQTATAATFTRTKKPSALVALILMLFLLIPGIIYLVLGGKTFSLSVSTRIVGDGKTAVQLAWNRNGAGKAPAGIIQRMLLPGGVSPNPRIFCLVSLARNP
jgi:hypothetical protein